MRVQVADRMHNWAAEKKRHKEERILASQEAERNMHKKGHANVH